MVWLAVLAVVTSAQAQLKEEVEAAFLRFDLDGNGIVSKSEIMEVLMKDEGIHGYSDNHVQEMVNAITEMTAKHDANNDGLDFMEMYTASGGKLQDLWIYILYSNIFHSSILSILHLYL